MIITLENRAIVFRLKNNSIHLKPLLHFVNHSFKRVKHFSNLSVVLSENSEEIKKKYLLNWAFKIHKKAMPLTSNSFLTNLISSYDMPIHITTTSANKFIAQSAVITIEQTDTFEIFVSCSQYHDRIAQYFKLIFKDTMTEGSQRTNFKINILTKSNLLTLKELLSKKEILNIPITFITHGLNFKRLHQDDTNSAQFIYKEKLQKSYKILSISNESTPSEMKRNYRNMLKKYHPDIVYNQNEDLVKLYTRRFQVIQNAYDFVKEHHKAG